MAGKRINVTKLKTMGLDTVRKVCVHHAEQAVMAQEHGDSHTFELHCALLDQCAAVAREMKGLGNSRYTAKTVVDTLCNDREN